MAIEMNRRILACEVGKMKSIRRKTLIHFFKHFVLAEAKGVEARIVSWSLVRI
jgi:hypothetical protein